MSIALMGDHLHPQKKIHPVVVVENNNNNENVDLEDQPTTPLVPRTGHGGSSKFDQKKSISSRPSFRDHLQHTRHYTVPLRPPLLGHSTNNIPVRINAPIPPPPKKDGCRSACCKCICYSISFLVVLLVIIGATIGILYLVFKPKIPQYSVNNLRVSDLRLNLDMSLYAKFNVEITTVNPNKKIGIHYEKGSQLSVWYSTTKLCQGTLPAFYQGHGNKTVLEVALVGQSQYGRTLIAALQEQQQTGRIPLDLKVDVPVRIQLGKLKLREVRILGDCSLIVDSLSANNKISIKASTCKFRLKL